MVEYDVLGNERHKAICKLRKLKCKSGLNGSFVCELANVLNVQKDGAPYEDAVLHGLIRDRLIHLLGGDQPTLSDLLKEDDDAVDARPSDSASADSPVHGSAGCACGGRCGELDEEVAPITTELRDMAERYCNYKDSNIVKFREEEFERLCDNIDAIHAGLERDYATACRVNEQQDLEYVDLAKRYDKTITLPFDKDGKVWRVGDELLDDGIVCEVVGIGPNRLYYYCDATDTVEWTQADSRRHYERKLAVEDVLDEMLQRFSEDSYEGGWTDFLTDFIAEYAAKLKLVDA